MTDDRADLMLQIIRTIESDVACIRAAFASQAVLIDRILSIRSTDTEH